MDVGIKPQKLAPPPWGGNGLVRWPQLGVSGLQPPPHQAVAVGHSEGLGFSSSV